MFTIVAFALYEAKIDIPFTTYAVVKNILSVIGIIGFAYAFPQFNIKTDISYGLYIYHMTIINAMFTLGYTGKLKYLFIAVLLSSLFAWLSTKTIGNFSLKKKIVMY